MKINLLFGIAFFFLFISVSNAQLNPDGNSYCNGDPSSGYSLRFGQYTGEGILSNRANNAFGNLYGLTFFTNSKPRLIITGEALKGNIGIGSYATPSARLSFGPYTPGTDAPLRLAIFDNGLRFGLGYFETTSPTFQRVFSFHLSDPINSRFGFFDNNSYTGTGVNGNEFVTFNAANRSVGINQIAPIAKLHVYNPGDVSELLRLENLYSTSPLITTSLVVKNFAQEVMIDALASSGTAPSLALNKNGNGNVTVGYFGATGPGSPILMSSQSKFHIQGGNIQISNSGVPTLGKTGITMGAAVPYSWIQSSSGPLLLNPLSNNSLTGAQTNNYVAIGFLPLSTELAVLPPAGYNLLVQGKIMCEELKIKLKKDANGNTVWYDHVLLPTYKLMTVDSLQSYITQNLHLPDVPSAKEVEENGIMAGEMNGILLKKVEELTLYMIEQNKNISNQNTHNQMQTKAIADQAEQIALLKQQNDLLMKQVDFLIQK
jgi:hypothetical protein